MNLDEQSWKVLGSKTSTLDRRLKDVFCVAGMERQCGDPVTYLGRHFGTRVLQHQGGSSEGGAARRGHGDGKTAGFHYTECPLPDLLRMAGNFADVPFQPAHTRPELISKADAVIAIIFPELLEERRKLDARLVEVNTMRGNTDRIRTDEQLNDRKKLVKSIQFCCRTALCCLVARPRTWKKWAILESEVSIWNRATDERQRVVRLLFAGNVPALQAMNALSLMVHTFEEEEIAARKGVSPVANVPSLPPVNVALPLPALFSPRPLPPLRTRLSTRSRLLETATAVLLRIPRPSVAARRYSHLRSRPRP